MPTKWRANSVFGPGLRLAMCRERRAVYLAKLNLARRPGRLTQAAREVGRVLLRLLGPDGRLDPCLTTVATLARVCVSSVVRALSQLRNMGFLVWQRRLRRDAGTGWRTQQHSNAYALAVPTVADVHFSSPVITKIIKEVGSTRTASAGGGDRAAREGAARQLELLGFADAAARMRATG